MKVIVIEAGAHYEQGEVIAVYPEVLRGQAETFIREQSDRYDWVMDTTLPLSGVAAAAPLSIQ